MPEKQLEFPFMRRKTMTRRMADFLCRKLFGGKAKLRFDRNAKPVPYWIEAPGGSGATPLRISGGFSAQEAVQGAVSYITEHTQKNEVREAK